MNLYCILKCVCLCVQENPYMMRKVNYQEFEGNDQYEGFCVDMLRELAGILKFNFRIKLVDDGLYGAPEPNGSWTGMVGELINRVCTVVAFINLFSTEITSIFTRLHSNSVPCHFPYCVLMTFLLCLYNVLLLSFFLFFLYNRKLIWL